MQGWLRTLQNFEWQQNPRIFHDSKNAESYGIPKEPHPHEEQTSCFLEDGKYKEEHQSFGETAYCVG